LSAASSVTADQVNIFATAKDKSLWYLTAQSRGNSNWISLGGELLSQPTAVAWNSSHRLDVFGVDTDHKVVYNTLEDGQWSNWYDLGSQAVSGMSACRSTYQEDRLDIWTLTGNKKSPNTIHIYWDSGADDWIDDGTYPDINMWDLTATQAPDKRTTSIPAVACRNNDIMHDLIIYDQESSAVLHRQWSKSQGRWLEWNDRGGSFIGDPVMISTSDDSIEFFGIGTDRAMYHFAWSNSSGYTDLENLNGTWASIPSVVKSAGGRLDVVALDADGHLKHRTRLESTWQSGWDDLGVSARSAPLAMSFDSTATIGVFALGSSGELLRGDFRIGTDGRWQAILDFSNVGGNLTDAWLMV
jgi:hypothetical protein